MFIEQDYSERLKNIIIAGLEYRGSKAPKISYGDFMLLFGRESRDKAKRLWPYLKDEVFYDPSIGVIVNKGFDGLWVRATDLGYNDGMYRTETPSYVIYEHTNPAVFLFHNNIPDNIKRDRVLTMVELYSKVFDNYNYSVQIGGKGNNQAIYRDAENNIIYIQNLSPKLDEFNKKYGIKGTLLLKFLLIYKIKSKI